MAIEEFEEITGSELIQDTFLFRNLNFTEAQSLAKICHREKFKPGDRIIEENSLGQALYLVEQGAVKVVKGEAEDQQEIARLKRGELFGEMSLIENELTSASVIAVSEVEVLAIHRREFEDLLEADPALALKVSKSFCKTLSERLRRTTEELSKIRQIKDDKKSRARSGSKDKTEKGEKGS